jgi:hypothetical protein
MTTRSGDSVRIARTAFIQLKGLTEFIKGRMGIPGGALPSSYCVFPGKRNPGYCNENDIMVVLCPDSIKFLAVAVLKLAIPPLRGCAGPIQMMFKIYRLMVSSIR